MSRSNDEPHGGDDRNDRDLIASMNEANSFEELETLTRMARARLNRRGGDSAGAAATQRLRRVLARSRRA
jgi:hypothetical protein